MKSLFYFVLFWVTSLSAQDFPRTLVVENNLARTLSTLDLESGNIDLNYIHLESAGTPQGVVSNRILSYRDRLLVLLSTPPEIRVYNPLTTTKLSQIALPEGSNPYDMALVGLNKLYVSLLNADAVAVVDLELNRVTKTLDVGRAPQGIYVDHPHAWITNSGGWDTGYRFSSISLIDVNRDSVTHTLDVPANPQNLAKGMDSRYYAVCTGNYVDKTGKVVVLEFNYEPPLYEPVPVITDTIDIGGFPGDIAVLPTGNAYVAAFGDASNGFLYKIDTQSTPPQILHGKDNPIRVKPGAMRLFFDSKTGDLYVNSFTLGQIQRFDPETDRVVEWWQFGDGAQGMTIIEPWQTHDPWADKVVSFTPGEPWSAFGYNYFPQNILGPPDPDKSIDMHHASGSARELLSLGHGGEIVLEFDDNVIIDGKGADFIVFENVFKSVWTNEPFREVARVAVSQDGQTFYEFPYDVNTGDGLAGYSPVKSTLYPTQPELSGADAFDISVLGLQWIKYVRLNDMGDEWSEGPYNGDFDLDAVVAIHSSEQIPSRVQTDELSVLSKGRFKNFPNPFNPQTEIVFELSQPGPVNLSVFSITGQLVRVLQDDIFEPGIHRVVWNSRDLSGRALASGTYLARLSTKENSRVIKMLLLR